MQRLTIIRPDDWHVHLRDDTVLRAVLPDTARRFSRAVVMPNIDPPVRTVEEARAYRDRILAALPADLSFEPLMTLYLTDHTVPAEIVRAKQSGFVHAVKYYPAGATTHSEHGVTDLRRMRHVIAEMESCGLPLLLHGEVTDPGVDIFDREAVFVERHLGLLTRSFPHLRMVFEHVTTKEGVTFVEQAGPNVAATITAHHLLFNRNSLLAGGLRPHVYCSPVLKRETHRRALVAAATGGNPKFFLGTDSAPHSRRAKEAPCGCAGIYTAHAALELYAEAFDQVGALDRLEGFASCYGPDFYRLPRNRDTVTLVKEPSYVSMEIAVGEDSVVPLRAGETVPWKLATGD